MTNKPMLSVERELLERIAKPLKVLADKPYRTKAILELRDLLDKPEDKLCSVCNGFGRYQDGDSGTDEDGRCPNIVDCDCGDSERIPEYRAKPAARNQVEPVAQSEFEPDAICLESDGCPTEGAVLKRFWRENQPDTELCKFYEAEDCQSLVKELVGHVAQLQDAAKRNVKPWEDTFPPTLLPAYIARINAEQPAPVVTLSKLMQAIHDVDGFPDVTGVQLLELVARLNGVKP